MFFGVLVCVLSHVTSADLGRVLPPEGSDDAKRSEAVAIALREGLIEKV